ncbi:MAG: hypothetical protein E7158_03675 [Firmicutes bacterium]|nr:hypothetical protein [Bacillota bacterium]
MSKYVRVMDGTVSNASGLNTPIGEVVEARDWDPNATERDDIKGINFSTEESILRWIRRGDTIYDVILPKDAEVKKVPGTFTPNGLFRTNKIILVNPVKLNQDLVLDLYNRSNLPEKTYHDVLAILAIRGFTKAADKLIKDKINDDNLDIYIDDYIAFENDINDGVYGLYYEYKEKLLNMKNRKINLFD